MRANLPIIALNGAIDTSDALGAEQLNLVAVRGNEASLHPIRTAMANRDGPIVPLVTENIAPNAYYNERTICVDTTAAGGNASLLAEAEI